MWHQNFQTIFHNLFFKKIFSQITSRKLLFNILKHDWRKIESNKFISDFDQTHSSKFHAMNQYLFKTDSLIETQALLKKPNKKKLKFLSKSWITWGLQNSFKKKNIKYSKSVKCKTQNLKEFYHNNYQPRSQRIFSL